MQIFEMKARVIVRFQVPGFHHWPQAAGERTYLANNHRHLFYVEVTIPVMHEQREVEFHDLLQFCKDSFPGGEMGPKSCETMAIELAKKVASHYDREATVSIFEDGEVGAWVGCYDANPQRLPSSQ